jgi:hypothetical protein
MGYVLAGLLVVVIVATAVTLVARSARKQGREAAADASHGEGLPGSDTAILATDRETPLGDTAEHSQAPR